MMHTPRLSHPNYIQHHNQWRPHSPGPRFGPKWPMLHNTNTNLKGNYFLQNNEDYWCETCDRGFKTQELLANHKQQHQKCNIDGCQFIAHPKVITKHIQMQHSTGLYKKIAKLHDPKEIEKWREERKKRYPTKENVEKRRAEIKEKIDRGEKMGMRTKQNYREHKHNVNKEHGMKRKGSYDINRKNFKRRCQTNKSFIEVNNETKVNYSKKPPVQMDNKSILQVDNSKILKPFTGILNLLEDDDDNNDVRGVTEVCDLIEDDEYTVFDESVKKDNSTTSEPVVCGALSSLICNYESSDDESDRTTKLKSTKTKDLNIITNVTEPNSNGKPNNITNISNGLEKSDDESGPEEAMIVKPTNIENNGNTIISHGDNITPALQKEIKEKNISNSKKSFPKKFKPKLPSTLLEKLLHNEIRQERNIVLQCIRFIIKNNYFEK